MIEEEEEEEEEESEEEKKESPEGEQPEDPNANPKEEDPENPKDDYQDDSVVKVKINGEIVEMTAKELSEGYMRQSDYTRKSQEVAEKLKGATPAEKQEAKKDAQEIVNNPENFPAEDVETAKHLLKIIKGTGIAKEFGLMTKEDFEAEKVKEKQVAEFGSRIKSAETEIKGMKGMPAFKEDEILEHMQATGIHDPKSAYLNKYDAQYRDFIIKQAKGDSSYQSDKGGKKKEPEEKVIDIRTDEGHRNFLADEIKKINN